ncbi:MAG: DNA phosphorothioation-dependent restriction protein DptG [Proteobacteria bacterium]|nr:DNA phosphorothioation-dependent restriction protein DptG [Pseudomonadota bacterium]
MYLNSKPKVTTNNLTTYFPIRTKDERREFDWDSILGVFIADAYRKELKNTDFSEFEILCEQAFKGRLDDPSFWNLLKEMYFDQQDALNIAPDFLLFKSEKKEDNRHNQRIGQMFMSLTGEQLIAELKPVPLNFIEKIIYDVLIDKAIKPAGEVKKRIIKEEVFLPFLAKSFSCDLNFLSNHPRYLLENINYFLKLYGFIYTCQLSLNLPNWNQGEPKPVKNYLILDVEKASQERREIRDYGYKQLLKHVDYLFPYLSMSEMLQEKSDLIKPLWAFADSVRNCSQSASLLNQFSIDFDIERGLGFSIQEKKSSIEALGQVLDLSKEQFNTGKKGKDDINRNYSKATLDLLCQDFIQRRGVAGYTLVINQDYLLLLTNIAIGTKEKLRFNELLKEFENRGVFFDRQSQAEIVQFYERIGNVERMSDSGDAVYVRKTV